MEVVEAAAETEMIEIGTMTEEEDKNLKEDCQKSQCPNSSPQQNSNLMKDWLLVTHYGTVLCVKPNYYNLYCICRFNHEQCKREYILSIRYVNNFFLSASKVSIAGCQLKPFKPFKPFF